MKMNIYAIRDKVVGETAPPFAAKNDEAAIRAFRGVKFPSGSPLTDFELVILGGYDSEVAHHIIFDGGDLHKVSVSNE